MEHRMTHPAFPLACLLGLLIGIPHAVAEQSAAQEDSQSIICRHDEQPLFQYRFREVPFKPCVSQLWTPAGINVLRDSPHDHVHHHALMLAVNVGENEFWAEDPNSQPPPGSQITDSLILAQSTKTDSAGIQSNLRWVTGRNQTVLHEKRTVMARHVGDDLTLLTWRSALTAAESDEPIELTGRHYHGLGLRFVESMDQSGRFLTSTGTMGDIIRGDERNTPCQWCAYAAQAEGKPVTVAIFDHPDNFRPMLAFTMGDGGSHFAYLAATLNLWKEPKPLAADQPITLCWDVAVWDGQPDAKQIEAVYQKWLEEGR
jgi:hypothetical protein